MRSAQSHQAGDGYHRPSHALGIMGLLVGVPTPADGQLKPPMPTVQSAELQEAKRLNEQAAQLYSQGQYSAAVPLAKRALAIFEKVLGPEHPDVATSLNNLAMLYQNQGNYKQAELLHQRALAIREKVLYPEHPDVAQSLNNLAGLYLRQGNYKQAQPLYKRAIDIREKVNGLEHPDVAQSLSNLAVLYQDQGNYKQALPLHKRALDIREKVLGPKHPDVAYSLINLAGLYQDQGNYKQALPLHKRAIDIWEKVLGLEHPHVAHSLNSLAMLYQQQGNYKKALPPFQRALTIQEKVLGPEHPDVAANLNNLAVFFWASGNIARAIEFQTRSTNIEEHNLALNLTTGSEAQKRALIDTLSGTTSGTVSLHVQGAFNNTQAAQIALTTVLQRKGRVQDVLTSSLLSLRQHLQPEDQTKLDQLAQIRSQLSALVFKGAANTPLNQYRQQFTSLEDKAQKLEAELSRRSDEFRIQSQKVTLEAVQKLIPTDAALVELVRYRPFNPKATKRDKRWGSPRYVAYILHHQGDPKWVDLGEAKTIDDEVDDFRDSLRNQKISVTKVKKVARALDSLLSFWGLESYGMRGRGGEGEKDCRQLSRSLKLSCELMR